MVNSRFALRKVAMNTRYKKKQMYWITAGAFFLCAGLWVYSAIARPTSSTRLIALLCAALFLIRAIFEVAAYYKDRDFLHIKVRKSGSLCFWGEWFGKPMDNIHTVIATEYRAKENRLVLHFKDGETCTVYDLAGIENTEEHFRISKASKIVWEWYPYGQEQKEENLCRRTYTKKDKNTVVIESFGEKEKGAKVLHFHELHALEIC